jgi:hypothetical protein
MGAQLIPSRHGKIVAPRRKAFLKIRPDARKSVSGHDLRARFRGIWSMCCDL